MPRRHDATTTEAADTLNPTPDAPEATVANTEPSSKANKNRKLPRREFVKGLVAAGLAGTASAAVAEEVNAPAVAPEDAITTGDIAAADKLAGRAYTDKQREQMTRSLGAIRQNIQTLRTGDTDPLLAPAVHFDPRLPGMKFATGKGSFRMSRVPLPHYDGNPESLAFASTVELSALIQAGKVTSMQLTRMYLDRLKTLRPAPAQRSQPDGRPGAEAGGTRRQGNGGGQYRGPLHGIPWGGKDLLATKQYPHDLGRETL